MEIVLTVPTNNTNNIIINNAMRRTRVRYECPYASLQRRQSLTRSDRGGSNMCQKKEKNAKQTDINIKIYTESSDRKHKHTLSLALFSHLAVIIID